MLGCRRLLAAPLRPVPLRALAGRAPSPYSVLGLPATAEAREIKETFYRLSKEHHPDLSKEQDSLEKFREIAAAYEVLSNPETRRQYDAEAGLARPPAPSRGAKAGATPGRAMRGTFRNGQFVDEDPTPNMRNIEYDLSPERMERLWGRYRQRWERREEVERVEGMERRKEEFRRKVEEKRARMGQMTEEEREDFLFKLRQLRPDAADPEASFTGGAEAEEKRGEEEEMEMKRRRRREREEERQELEKRMRMRREERKSRDEQQSHMREGEKRWREENLRPEEWGEENPRTKGRAGQEGSGSDPFFENMNTNDPGSWGSFKAKAWEGGREAWRVRREEGRGARLDKGRQGSVRHGIHGGRGRTVGEVLIFTLLAITGVLAYGEILNDVK